MPAATQRLRCKFAIEFARLADVAAFGFSHEVLELLHDDGDAGGLKCLSKVQVEPDLHKRPHLHGMDVSGKALPYG